MSDKEPAVRMAISNIENAVAYTDRLRPGSSYVSALDSFRHHALEAVYQLEQWAKANEIEIRDRMLT